MPWKFAQLHQVLPRPTPAADRKLNERDSPLHFCLLWLPTVYPGLVENRLPVGWGVIRLSDILLMTVADLWIGAVAGRVDTPFHLSDVVPLCRCAC